MLPVLVKCTSHPQENTKHKQGKEKCCSDRKRKAGICTWGAQWTLGDSKNHSLTWLREQSTMRFELQKNRTQVPGATVFLLFQILGLSMTDQKGGRWVPGRGQRVYGMCVGGDSRRSISKRISTFSLVIIGSN